MEPQSLAMELNQVLPSSLSSILPTLPAYTHFAGHPVVTTYSFSRTRDQVFIPSTTTTTVLPAPAFVSYTNAPAPLPVDKYQTTTYNYKPVETGYTLPTTFPLPYQITSSPPSEVYYPTAPLSNVQTTTYQINSIPNVDYPKTFENFATPQIPTRRYSLASQPQPLYSEVSYAPQPRRAYSLGNPPISYDKIAMASRPSVDTPVVVGYSTNPPPRVQPSTAPYRPSVQSVAPRHQESSINRVNYNPSTNSYNVSVPLDAYVAQRRKSAPHIIYEIPATRSSMEAMKEMSEVIRQEGQREAMDRWVRYREQDRLMKSNRKATRSRVKSLDPAPRRRTNWL